MRNTVEILGVKDEQNKWEKISSAEEFNGVIGTEIAEIRNYYNENAKDWIENFKKGLNEIEILTNTEEAAKFLNGSILEKVPSRIGVLMENLNNFNSDKLSEEEKNILLEKLNNLFN